MHQIAFKKYPGKFKLRDQQNQIHKIFVTENYSDFLIISMDDPNELQWKC